MQVDRLFSVFKTAGKGMAVQRRQLQVSSENIANANTTRVEGEDGPYKPKELVLSQSKRGGGFSEAMQRSRMRMRQTRMEHMENDRNTRYGLREDGPQSLGPNDEVAEVDRYRYEYDPSHPDADENGMVKYPDLDLVEEMTRMVSANRLYEANLSVVEAEKDVIKQALQI
ncbi:MAG: flagellar basal body rod protein FlgC [Bacteroidota bacterium]